MNVLLNEKPETNEPVQEALDRYVPREVLPLKNSQTDIPRIAKDEKLVALIEDAATGQRDAGQRTAVTGGAQMNGFITLMRELLCDGGLPKAHVYCERYIEIQGWYRPEKKWDLLIVADGKLLAGIEFKSQVGSFGKRFLGPRKSDRHAEHLSSLEGRNSA